MFCEIIFWATTIPTGFAQQPDIYATTSRYTLTDVWAKLLLNSKKMTIAELTVERDKEQLKDARKERLPNIEIGGEYERLSNLPEYTNGIFHDPQYYPITHEAYSFNSTAYFDIYDGNKLNLKISERKTQSQISAEEKKQVRAELKVLAAAYYLDLERSYIFKKLMTEDISDQEKQLIKIKVLQKNGVVLKSDVLRADLKLSKQKFFLVQIQNDIIIINQKLSVLIEPDSLTLIEPIQGFTPDTISLKAFNAYLGDAMANSFQIHIANEKNNIKALGVKFIKSDFLPKVGLFSNYAFSYPQGVLYPYANALYGLGNVGINVSWTISSFFKNREKVKTAELDFRSQVIYAEDLSDSVKTQVTEAYLRFKEALIGIEVARKNVIQATENLRVLTNSYFNQTALITDLLDADTQKLQTGFDLESSKMNAQLKYFQLQQIIGNL